MRPRLFIFLVFGVLTSAAYAQKLPDGWRLPTAEELVDVERDDSVTKHAKATADFNGDGIDDEALLLKSTKFSGEGLWVHLSQGSKRKTWKKLITIDWGPQYPKVDLAMGIDVVPPGEHTFACYDWEKECDFSHSRPPLRLKMPSIAYFKPGSSSSMFYWSARHQKFIQVWISD